MDRIEHRERSRSKKRFDAIARQPIGRVLALLGLCLMLFLPGFIGLPPSDRDESRFAQASKQMIESGDYVDIRFQDEARYKKPVGIYWLQAASASALGGAEAPIWAYRIPSLFGAIFGSLLMIWAASPLVGRRGAFLAAAMMASCVLLGVEARIAKTDAMLFACSVAALGGLARFYIDRSRSWFDAAIFWTAIAGGILLKGPMILVPVIGAVLWIGISERKFAFLGRARPWFGIPWVLLLCAPWFAAIMTRSSGEFVQASLFDDLGKKLLSGVEAHGGPPGYHLVATLGTFWPWVFLLLLALPAIWANRRKAAFRLLLGWTIPFWVLLELTPTKLPHYPLPVYPALAIMTAAIVMSVFVEREDSAPSGWRLWVPLALWSIPAFGLPIAAMVAPFVIEGNIPLTAIAAGVPALLTAVMAVRAILRWNVMSFFWRALATAFFAYAAMFSGALPKLKTAHIAPRLEAALDRCAEAGESPVALVGFHEPSAVFELGTETQLAGANEVKDLIAQGYSVWVSDRMKQSAFGANAPDAQARVDGFNYNRGKTVSLGLYASEPLGCALR